MFVQRAGDQKRHCFWRAVVVRSAVPGGHEVGGKIVGRVDDRHDLELRDGPVQGVFQVSREHAGRRRRRARLKQVDHHAQLQQGLPVRGQADGKEHALQGPERAAVGAPVVDEIPVRR